MTLSLSFVTRRALRLGAHGERQRPALAHGIVSETSAQTVPKQGTTTTHTSVQTTNTTNTTRLLTHHQPTVMSCLMLVRWRLTLRRSRQCGVNVVGACLATCWGQSTYDTTFGMPYTFSHTGTLVGRTAPMLSLCSCRFCISRCARTPIVYISSCLFYYFCDSDIVSLFKDG